MEAKRCLCFEYNDNTSSKPDIDNGGWLTHPGPDGSCKEIASGPRLHVPVTNEACLFSLWMCACWAN